MPDPNSIFSVQLNTHAARSRHGALNRQGVLVRSSSNQDQGDFDPNFRSPRLYVERGGIVGVFAVRLRADMAKLFPVSEDLHTASTMPVFSGGVEDLSAYLEERKVYTDEGLRISFDGSALPEIREYLDSLTEQDGRQKTEAAAMLAQCLDRAVELHQARDEILDAAQPAID